MSHNPILEEIYAARRQLLAAHNGDLHAYMEGAWNRALASGRAIVDVSHQEQAMPETADRTEPSDR